MSLNALAWALRQAGLKPTEKLVLIVLADHADGDATCFPSMRRISEIVGIQRRSIAKAVAHLESLDLLQRIPRHRPNGSLTTNCFVLALGDVPQDMTPRPTGQDRNRNNGVSSVDTDKTPLSEGLPFKSFKAAYPQRDGDNEWSRAERYWGKMGDAARALAVTAAERYKGYIQQKEKEGTEYVKMAATFLSPKAKAYVGWATYSASTKAHYNRLPPKEKS
jgi:hypothetical protein